MVFMNIIPATYSKSISRDTNFSNYFLTVDAYSNIPKLYRLENITHEEVMDKLNMFQARFGKVDEFGWWDIQRTQTDAVTQFNSKEFQEGPSIRGGKLALAAPDHQEMNSQSEVIWQTLRTIAH